MALNNPQDLHPAWRQHRAGLFIFLNVIAVTASQIVLKRGAVETAGGAGLLPWLGVTALLSYWVWLGIILLVVGFFFWIGALRRAGLAVAFACANAVHVTIPLASVWFLDEKIDMLRWGGIALVLVGLALVSRSNAARRVL
jgi:undecaprenyl phosphate-alpha-L-ara4N flippase subunit ArnE